MATFSTKDHRPFIIIPSPFEFDILEFLPRKRVGCKTSNAFMIYRKIYVKTLLKQQLHYKMTDASNWASKAWKEEPEHVKIQFQEYAKNLKEVYNQRAQAFIAQQKQPPPSPQYQQYQQQIQRLPSSSSSSSSSPYSPCSNDFIINSIDSENINFQDPYFPDTNINFENNGFIPEFLNMPINPINSINHENSINSILNSPIIDNNNNNNNNNNDNNNNCKFCNINIAECTCPDELFQLNFIQSPLPIPFSPIIFENSPIIFDNNYDDNYENYDNNYDNYENYVNNVYGFNDENYLPKQ